LAKGIGYPMFIALTNFFGIPLFFAQHILLTIAAYLMVRALSPLVKNTNLKILLFAVLLFNPVTSDQFTIRVLRDHFFVSTSVIVVAGFIALYLRRGQHPRALLKWSLVAGMALFVQQNTREEGFVFFPFLIFLSALTLLAVVGFEFVRVKFQHVFCVLKRHCNMLLIIVLPYFLLILGNLTLASINYVVYGGFIRNEIKSEAFSRAFAALTKIDSEKWIIDVPVTTEARMKAYRVSPAFAELQKYMEGEGNGFLHKSKYSNEITGAHFMWALRYAAEQAGYHQSLVKSQKLYKQIALEINNALETGKLKKRDIFSMSSFSWDNRFTIPTLLKSKEIAGFIMSFKGYSPMHQLIETDLDGLARFQNITNERAYFSKYSDTTQPLPSRIKLRALMFIAKVYGFVNPAIAFTACISLIVLTVLVLARKATKTVKDYWLLSSIFLLLSASRMVLMAFISVSQWNAVNMHYLSLGYPFMILFEVLSIAGVIHFLLKPFRAKTNSEILNPLK
jgi:hypothetical protein